MVPVLEPVPSGGLDLRAGASYDALVNVAATSGDCVRMFPDEQDFSLVCQKVAAKVDGLDLLRHSTGRGSG